MFIDIFWVCNERWGSMVRFIQDKLCTLHSYICGACMCDITFNVHNQKSNGGNGGAPKPPIPNSPVFIERLKHYLVLWACFIRDK